MFEKTNDNEPALEMSYETLEMESKLIDKALDSLIFETLIDLNAIPAPVALNFQRKNEIFFLTFGGDEKHAVYFFPDRTVENEMFISINMEEDYLHNIDITNSPNEFFEIMKFYNKLSVTLNNPNYIKEVSNILINYYQESKDLLHKAHLCNKFMMEELMKMINK